MKKIIKLIVIAILVLVVLAVLAVHFFLDAGLKRGVETVGPMMTKVPVKVDSVSLSIMSGSGSIKGLVVGNPEGYKTPSAISVGKSTLSIVPSSLLSEKTIIHQVNVQGPEITYETDLKGSNLKKILANVEEATGGGDTIKEPAPPKEKAKAAKKLQVDDFMITGGKIHVNVNVLGVSQGATVALPEIHLQNLGTNADGITAAELTKQILQVVLNKAVEAAGASASDLVKNASGLTKNINIGTNNVESLTKGVGDLFKKKK
jgi:uncharacterized protein involved in outer membrane biogenesis